MASEHVSHLLIQPSAFKMARGFSGARVLHQDSVGVSGLSNILY